MGFIKYLAILVTAMIIYVPIDKKYKLRSKYHNHANKHFRLFIFLIGLLSIAIEIIIAFLSDDYLKSIGANRDLVSVIFGIPLLFVLMVGMPFTDNK